MKNPFFKFLGEEDMLQKAILDYIHLQYPKAIVAHPANEGKRSAFERFKISWLGLSPGLPDLLIFTPTHHYNGLALEIKAGKNKMTPNQLKWHEKLFSCRWQCACVRNLDTAIEIINEYFKKPKQHGTTTLN